MRLRVFSVISAAALTVALSASLSGCVACPAIGYLYDGPAVLEFVDPLPDDAIVAACIGVDCEPTSVTQTDQGAWEVPQESPYINPSSLGDGSERELRVVVTSATGDTIGNDSFEIPTSGERTGWFGQCPGPFAFEPVQVEFS